MNKFIEQVIDETFRSKKQQRYFYAKANDETASEYDREKWKKRADEFSAETDFDKLPEEAEEQKLSNEVHNGQIDELEDEDGVDSEVDEIVDADGNIETGDMPGNPNAYIRSKKTTDQVAKSTMGQMGSFGVLGGATGANKTLKYWAESDMSKALGNEIKNDSDKDLDDAKEYFEKDLEVSDEDEAKERAKQMGFDPELPEGKIRLIEDPRKYIEEYLTKKVKNRELVKKQPVEAGKKVINPVLKKQLGSMKQTLKANNLTISDITEYLEDNE